MRALISVSNKTGIVAFAYELIKLGYEIISTGGTFRVLQENNIKVIPVDQITEFPEILDGRVKTLHPKIHGSLLALRSKESHLQACEKHHIKLIDLVVVNLYPFEKTISKKNIKLEEAIENIDIGGPSMLRSAAKNYQSVGVIVNPDKYEEILTELKNNKGELTPKTKALLACEAFQHTARYDSLIANFLSEQSERKEKRFNSVVAPVLKKLTDLRYGENPHQQAALYKIVGQTGLTDLEQLHGKELSYNNMIDLDAAWQIVRELDLPGVAIIKHTNPCGAAIADNISTAYKKAYEGDPISAFGSIVALNKNVDKKTAEQIDKTFVEAVIAPDFDGSALEILKKKSSIRLIKYNNSIANNSILSFKHIPGGFLVQSLDSANANNYNLKPVTEKKINPKLQNDLLFAFSIVKHIKSNAIVVVKDGQVLGVGAGQMSRVDSMEIALKKAGKNSKGAVIGSDAFFPFKDSIELAAKAGIEAIIQPGGSKRDQEVIDACDANNISMIMTGIRHFKH